MILLILLFLFIAVGFPISFSLGLAALHFFLTNHITLVTYAQRFSVGLDNFSLLAAPFFILCGEIMNKSGITDKIFRFANSLVGFLPGGLGHVNVLASTLFAGMSGTAIADAAGLGPIEIKAMKDHGYDVEFSTAVTAASSVIGPIIPPSTVMVLYGVTANVSISALFMGGVIPGLLLAIALMSMVAWFAMKRHYPRDSRFRIREVGKSFLDAIWAMLTPVIIIGGILSGICTATEAGAIAAVYSLFVGICIYKTIRVKDIPGILWKATLTTGTILVIVTTATLFGWCLTYAKIPQTAAAALAGFTQSKFLMMLLLTVVYLFLGMIMETSAIILTTVPILLPVITALGINPVYFGVIIALLMSIGTITPPVGTVLFILSKSSGIGIERQTRELLPWYGVLGTVVLLCLAMPSLVTFLPSLLGMG
ncbi:MAG: TRAP transporter large permease [Lachnospiraceae bacterium]|nr:TRAP transporter large permease [Lachnospiraceae bacterium]